MGPPAIKRNSAGGEKAKLEERVYPGPAEMLRPADPGAGA